MIRSLVVSAALVAAVVGAPAASALVECQEGDVQCYRTCYLPQYEKDKGIYWYAC